MPLQFQYGLLCDDVRREDSAKLILIGVYGRNIGLPTFPIAISLHLVVGLLADEPINKTLELQVLLEGKTILNGRGQLDLAESGRALFNVPNMLLKIDGPGLLDFQARLEGDEWKTICSMPVVHSDQNK